MTAGKQWQAVPLADVFRFQEGPGVRTWQFTTSGIKLLNVGNIETGGALNLTTTARHLNEAEVAKKYSHFLVDEGDLVVASSGISFDSDGLLRTRGAFVRQQHLPLCLNTSTIRFKARDGVSDLRFLRHWLDSRDFRSQITKLVTGTAQQNFGPSHLRGIWIRLPPLPEQRRISVILDKADELRAKRRAALEQLNGLPHAIFWEMFGDPSRNERGWKVRAFRELLAEPLRNGVSPSKSGRVQLRVLTLSAITGVSFDETAVKSAMFANEVPPNQRVSEKDFLICRGNGNLGLVGKGYFPLRAMPNVVFPDTIIAGRVDHGQLSSRFLETLWNSQAVRRQVETLARTTTGTFKVNQSMLEGIRLIVPPLPSQETFSTRVDVVRKLLGMSQRHLNTFHGLFATLQHQAFSGEL